MTFIYGLNEITQDVGIKYEENLITMLSFYLYQQLNQLHLLSGDVVYIYWVNSHLYCSLDSVPEQ